jgi:parvulin-like peptidyl-prolyl isomerase
MAQAAVVSQGVQVSELDGQKFYQRQSDPKNANAQFYQPATTTLRAIGVADQGRALKALGEINDNVPFETVVREYQDGEAAQSGGIMAPVVFGRSMLHKDAPLERKVFDLAVGRQLGPVPFNGKWWIFQCVERAPAVTTPYPQVREDCLLGAKLVKGLGQNGRQIRADFWKFQQSAKIQAFWSQYQPATRAQ